MTENGLYLAWSSQKYLLPKIDNNLNTDYSKHILYQGQFGRKHFLPGKYIISSIIYGFDKNYFPSSRYIMFGYIQAYISLH